LLVGDDENSQPSAIIASLDVSLVCKTPVVHAARTTIIRMSEGAERREKKE
jgi:hypothetical protein